MHNIIYYSNVGDLRWILTIYTYSSIYWGILLRVHNQNEDVMSPKRNALAHTTEVARGYGTVDVKNKAKRWKMTRFLTATAIEVIPRAKMLFNIQHATGFCLLVLQYIPTLLYVRTFLRKCFSFADNRWAQYHIRSISTGDNIYLNEWLIFIFIFFNLKF